MREVVRGGSIIMPGVASKALEMFARMAHGQACISIDDKQTEELQDNEWKIIREVGCGLSNKEIAAGQLMPFCGQIRTTSSMAERAAIPICCVRRILRPVQNAQRCSSSILKRQNNQNLSPMIEK